MAYGMSGRVFHAPFLEAHPGFELKAVVERHEKKAAARYVFAAADYSCQAFVLNGNFVVLAALSAELELEAVAQNLHVLIAQSCQPK